MNIEMADMQNSAYSNFIESVKSTETQRTYRRNLAEFLRAIPGEVFQKHLGRAPGADVEALSESFVALAQKDPDFSKLIIKTYIKKLKERVEADTMNPNTVPNKIKPIKALFASNEIDMAWMTINKMLPSPTKSEDRAYTREEIRTMLEHCASPTDKIILLMFSSGGFRLGAWDHFCWKDLVFFKKEEEFEGAALRVYRGYPEEYWTFVTPETCRALELYRKEWRYRFLRMPKDDDPLLVSVRYDRPVRLAGKGVKSRVIKLVSKAGMRAPNQKKYDVKLDHGFRKYFNTMLRRAKVNYLDKEDMMGHKVGLESHYERYEEQDFERFPEYKKAIPFLTISDEDRLRAEMQEKESHSVKNDALKKTNAKLLEDIRGLKKLAQQLEDIGFMEMIERYVCTCKAGQEKCPGCLAASGMLENPRKLGRRATYGP